MRRLVYGVATSLDGFIAGPAGECDWITPDSGIDFIALYGRFDTLLMGRRTYDIAKTRPGLLKDTGLKIVVASTTLDPATHPGLTIVGSDLSAAVAALKLQAGKDIWLMGGSVLFGGLLDLGLVDEVNVCLFPVMLGSGTPLMTEGSRVRLELNESKALSSGVVMLSYAIKATRAKA